MHSPSKKEFADLVVARIRERGESRSIVQDEAAFSLHIAPETETQRTLFLGNSYAEYCAAPNDAARAELLHNLSMSAMTVEAEETLDEVRVNLMPRVRPRVFYEVGIQKAAAAMARPGADKPAQKPFPYKPMAEHMGVGVAIDRPTAIQDVGDAEAWKVSFDELADIALANLRRRSKEDFVELSPGLFASPWRDHYDPERMLLVDKISALSVRGAPVAMIPNRHTLLVTGEADSAGLAAMMRIANETLAGPRPLTGLAFVLRGGTWEQFSPSGGDEVSARLRTLALEELGGAYTEQKELLEEKLASEGEDVFVASIMTAEKDGRITQLSVWSSGVDTLLPETPLVALNDMEHARHVVAPFEVVREIMGDAMQKRPGMYPPRWVVRSFPTSEQLDRIEVAAKARLPQGFETMGDRSAPRAPAPAHAWPAPPPSPPPMNPWWQGSPQRSSGRHPVWIALGVIAIALSCVRIGLRSMSRPSLPTYTPLTLPTPLPTFTSTSTARARPRAPMAAFSAATVATAGRASSLAVDDQRVYWIDAAKGEVLSAPRKIDPTAKAAAATTLAKIDAPSRRHGQSLVVEGDALYALRAATDGTKGALVKIAKTGGAPTVLAEVPGNPEAIAIAAGAAYVASSTRGSESGAITRVALRGGKAEPFASAPDACALFADAKDVFFVERGLKAGGVKRVAVKGGDVDTIAASAGVGCSLAGDAARVVWPLPDDDTVMAYARDKADLDVLGTFAGRPSVVALQDRTVYVLGERMADALDESGNVFAMGAGDVKPRLLVADQVGLNGLAARGKDLYWSRFDETGGEGAIGTLGTPAVKLDPSASPSGAASGRAGTRGGSPSGR